MNKNTEQTQRPASGIAVDASCNMNSDDRTIEYRGIILETGDIFFYKSFPKGGSNNIGEFLALVHALALLKNQGIKADVFSDSLTALKWVQKRKANISPKIEGQYPEIMKIVERAERWLQSNEFVEPLKWNTKQWQEIPADFGRK